MLQLVYFTLPTISGLSRSWLSVLPRIPFTFWQSLDFKMATNGVTLSCNIPTRFLNITLWSGVLTPVLEKTNRETGQSTIYFLLDLILYVPSTIFQLQRDAIYLTLCLPVFSAYNDYKQFGPRSDPTFCRVWSGFKLFDTLMVFLKEFFKKVDFEKNQQTIIYKSMKNYRVGKELKTYFGTFFHAHHSCVDTQKGYW